MDFDGQAIYPHLIIGVTLSTLRVSHDLPYDMHDTSASDHLPWENMVSVLCTAVLVRKLSFDLKIMSEGAPPPDCEQNLLALCHRLLRLEHLSGLPLPMDLPSLQHFTTSSVRSLELKIAPEIACQFVALQHPSPLFPNLEKLMVETDDLGAMQALLTCNGFANLAVLHVVVQHYHTPCDVSFIFNLIGHYKPNIKLESLQISDDNPRHIAPISTPVFLTIHPILLYHDLTILDINVACSVILDNQVLGHMVKAWPHLQELHLRDWTNPSSRATKITLQGVLLLARCSKLNSLSLCLDAQSPIPDPCDVVPAPELESFCVCRSPATCSSTLVPFLRMVFPELRKMTYGYSRHHLGFGFPDGLTTGEEMYFKCWQDIWNTLCN